MIDTESLAELDAARKEIERQKKMAREIEMENRLYEHEDISALRSEIARLKASMPCGHPGACVVTGAEGTQYCGACEGEKVIEDGIRSECETLAQFALSHAWGQEKHWRERFERLKAFFERGRYGDWHWSDGRIVWYPPALQQQELNAILGEGDE